jgi:hypothetical protein
MKPVDYRSVDDGDESWNDASRSEGWTGEPDAVAAIALVACLAIAALIFVLLAAIELSP